MVKIFKLMSRQDFETDVWSLFCYWYDMKFNLGRDCEARFGQDFYVNVLSKCWYLVETLKLVLGQDSEDEIWARFV